MSRSECRQLGATEKALSLLELMAALFILGLLATLVPRALDGMSARWKLRADAQNVESVLRWAQNAAAADGEATHILYDVPLGAFWVRRQDEVFAAHQLSSGVRFQVVEMGTIRIVNDRARVTAYPDGTVDAHNIILSGQKGLRIGITYDRLTGEATYKEAADALE